MLDTIHSSEALFVVAWLLVAATVVHPVAVGQAATTCFRKVGGTLHEQLHLVPDPDRS